jgi:membrane dipeptidase
MTTLTRRGVILTAAAAAAAPAGWAQPQPPGTPLGFDHWVVVNALGGLGNPNPGADKAGESMLTRRVLDDARASGLTVVNCTLGYVAGPEDPFESTVADIAHYDRMIAMRPDRLMRVTTAADFAAAKTSGKVGILYGFQNTAMLGDKLDRVDLFAGLGVRVFQLTYNPAGAVGDGSMAPLNRGLTPFGREVVARLNANKVMVDLSHSGQQTCLEAARLSAQPISINHTGCRALMDLPRNKTDEELRLVADRGGFVGIYFMPYLVQSGHPTAQDVVAHIDHAVNVCGEDHVGVGTDGEVTQIDDLEAYKAALAEEIAHRKALGIGATGERPDTWPFTVDLRGPQQFRKLAALLGARGYSTGRIEKILGANFVRYAGEVWGA